MGFSPGQKEVAVITNGRKAEFHCIVVKIATFFKFHQTKVLSRIYRLGEWPCMSLEWPKATSSQVGSRSGGIPPEII